MDLNVFLYMSVTYEVPRESSSLCRLLIARESSLDFWERACTVYEVSNYENVYLQ